MYQEYTIYNAHTGQILGHGSCLDTDVQHVSLQDDQDIVHGRFDYTHRINPDTFEAELINLPYPEMPVYHFHELQKYISDDVLLDKAIQNLGKDPKAFRLAHWKEFRKWLYPPIEDFVDAQVKSAKSKETGTALDQYYQKCWDTKTRFPKPTKTKGA